MDANGLRRHFGGRHHDCQSNAVYREHIRRYVTAFAGHFAKNPSVIGWQVDNELGNSHGDLCFCPSCEERFRQWLREKYGTVESLNEHWGTVFWSQDYSDFSQVTAPRTTAAGQNPAQLLDWKRFCSDLVLEFHQFQAEIQMCIRDRRWTAPPPSFSAGIPPTGNPDTGNNGFRPSPGTRASRPLSNTGCCNRMSFLTPPSPRPAAGQTV